MIGLHRKIDTVVTDIHQYINNELTYRIITTNKTPNQKANLISSPSSHNTLFTEKPYRLSGDVLLRVVTDLETKLQRRRFDRNIGGAEYSPSHPLPLLPFPSPPLP